MSIGLSFGGEEFSDEDRALRYSPLSIVLDEQRD